MKCHVSVSLTVYFDVPFWVCVFEKVEKERFRTMRIVLGTSEPKDYEIYKLINEIYFDLQYGKSIHADLSLTKKHKNPKRVQREINKILSKKGISTKSQEAIRISREENKLLSKKARKIKKEKLAKEQFQLTRLKKKEKKKGH